MAIPTGDGAAEQLYVTHLGVKNWRNFTNVSVDLPRRAFIVGPNASGKSNLLDVFRFLCDLCSQVGGGFQSAVDSRGDLKRLRSLSARQVSDIEIHVRVGNDSSPATWEYELKFNQRKNEAPRIRRERITLDGKELLSRPNKEDQDDPQRLTETYLEQVNMNRQFRGLAEFFASATYLHIVPQLVRDPERSKGVPNDPYGGDFLEQLALTPDKKRKSRLKRLRDTLRVAVPQLTDLELVWDQRGAPHLSGKYEHWRPRGAWQFEDQFSDGTLRLLGLLWALQEGSGPLLLEEPELSLHPEVVQHIPQLFARVQGQSGRQIIVSTHSPDMLRDSGIALSEVVMLTPTKEGTKVALASSIREAQSLLQTGSSVADIVIANTRPKDAAQLSLFDFGSA